MRAVIHFRVESLFTSVEVQRRPELAGKPVMVAKSSGNTSGVVVSVSPEARSFGACEGMTVRHAQRLCPNGVFVSADYALYRSVSSAVMDVLSNYSPILEPDSLDRAWLDVTASRRLFGGPKQMAMEAIRIVNAMGYSASAGIASNKLVAQIASDTGRLRIVAPGREQEFISPIPVGALPGVGEKTTRRLNELGVRTIGQLALVPERLLTRQFGVTGERLHRLALGVDHCQVKQMWPPEVINTEHMFTNSLLEPSYVESELGPIAERLALELRSQNRLAERVEFSVYADPLDLQSATSQRPSLWRLKRPVNRAADILFALKRLLPMQMRPGMEASGVSITLSDLTMGEGLQLCLLGDSERRRKLDVVMESVHLRFGDSALIYASSLAAAGRERVIFRVAL